MRKIIATVCVLLSVCLALPGLAQEAEGRTMVLYEVTGGVTVALGGRAAFPAVAGMRMAQGYALTCADDGEALLLIDDSIFIGLAPQSRAHISQATGNSLKITLEYGELYFNVTEPLGEDEDMSLDSAGASMGIRGTVGALNLQLRKLILSTMRGRTITTFGGEGKDSDQGRLLILNDDDNRLTQNDLGDALADSDLLFSTVMALLQGIDISTATREDIAKLQAYLRQLSELAGQQNDATNAAQIIKYLEDILAVDAAYTALENATIPGVILSAMQAGMGLSENLRQYALEQAAVIVNDQSISINWLSGAVNADETVYEGVQFSLSRNTVSRASAIKTIALLPDPADLDALAVASAKAAMTNCSVSLPAGATRDDITKEARDHVDVCIERTPQAAGVTATVSHAGGTRYHVALTKGAASDSTDITVIVTVAEDADIAAVEDAADIISGIDYGELDGAQAESQQDAVDQIMALIDAALGL